MANSKGLLRFLSRASTVDDAVEVLREVQADLQNVEKFHTDMAEMKEVQISELHRQISQHGNEVVRAIRISDKIGDLLS